MKRVVSKMAAGLAAVVALTGCFEYEDPDGHESMVRKSANSYKEAESWPNTFASSNIENVNSEKEAIEAFNTGKNLIWKGYFAFDDIEASGNYACAENMFEKSLRFYARDLEDDFR